MSSSTVITADKHNKDVLFDLNRLTDCVTMAMLTLLRLEMAGRGCYKTNYKKKKKEKKKIYPVANKTHLPSNTRLCYKYSLLQMTSSSHLLSFRMVWCMYTSRQIPSSPALGWGATFPKKDEEKKKEKGGGNLNYK